MKKKKKPHTQGKMGEEIKLITGFYFFGFPSLDAGMEDENPSAECEACSESKKKGQVMEPGDAITTDANTLTA